MTTALTKMLNIKHPIIMAPMFLVSNAKMIVAALDNGITGAFPALNYRTEAELRSAIREIKEKSSGLFGVNLIVNKSNIKLDYQLKVCVEEEVGFVITSLGSPKEVIKQCKAKGIFVFCDVVDVKYAKKVEELGADGIIAVDSSAGGHCGPMSKEELIPLLKKECNILVISAGGVTSKSDVDNAVNLGADGVSVGTLFIATQESEVSEDYKNAIVQYGAKDIILTKQLSGSSITVINTPYMQSLDKDGGFLTWLMKALPFMKKYIKMLIMYKGMKSVEQAALKPTYKTVWCAGTAIEHVKSIVPVKEAIGRLI
ncbi:MAG: nitronate monooxygenase [Glaciecola sp.]|jgi:nitronate monooxygenase